MISVINPNMMNTEPFKKSITANNSSGPMFSLPTKNIAFMTCSRNIIRLRRYCINPNKPKKCKGLVAYEFQNATYNKSKKPIFAYV